MNVSRRQERKMQTTLDQQNPEPTRNFSSLDLVYREFMGELFETDMEGWQRHAPSCISSAFAPVIITKQTGCSKCTTRLRTQLALLLLIQGKLIELLAQLQQRHAPSGISSAFAEELDRVRNLAGVALRDGALSV